VNDALRILQLHNRHASLGGALEVLSHEGDLLTAAGHRVEQFTLPSAEQLGLSSVRAGAKAVWNKEAAQETVARIHSFQPDVVHVHTPFPLMSPSVFRAAKRCGVPTVVTLHSFRFACVAATCHRDGHICEDCVGRRVKWPAVQHKCYHNSAPGSGALALSLLVHRTAGTFHNDIDRYLALTRFGRDLMIRDGYPADKIVVKPNSVPDPEEVGSPDLSDPYLLFASRLIDVKGVRTLLEAWRQLPDVRLRLVIVGDGELRDLVEAAQSADDRIEFRGWVDEGTVTDLMSRAVATLVPSEWYEGLPLVILRSLSVGTPVLVSDLENISTELLQDGAGRSFHVGEAVDLARAIEAMWADPDTTDGMRLRARQSFEERYSPSVDVRRLESLYRQLIESR
jgi:glycosyltransferase involved in cell wall biosynthesis